MTLVGDASSMLSDITGRVLIVGLGPGRVTHDLRAVPYVALSGLTAALLHKAAPDLVISALFWGDLGACDAFALVERLESLNYRGRILVLCQGMPRPDLIEMELQALGPGQQLSLISRD